MKTKLFLSATLLLFFTQSCDVMTYNTFNSYITTYYDYDDIALTLTDKGNIRISYDTVSFHKEYRWNSTGQNKIIYDSLCTVHNDLGYNKKRAYIGAPDWGNCSTFGISHIDVVSNNNYDELHPTGELLNDIIYFISASPKKYIDSGYNFTYDWDNETPEIFKKEPELTYNFCNTSELPNYSPIVHKLSDIEPNELVMLPAYYFGYLVFESSPTKVKEQKLTVTFSLSNGKKISKVISVNFE